MLNFSSSAKTCENVKLLKKSSHNKSRTIQIGLLLPSKTLPPINFL
ncbi:hypothetical protein BGS_0847 [Beggiatoa sp. SS]|nr:hypothetical protein BGS_0847 [Beggiatoa sp. SS]